MSRIFWDTNLFIYLFEQAPVRAEQAANLLKKIDERDDELVTSWMTVAEIQVKPRKTTQSELCLRYSNTVQQLATVVPFDEGAAQAYLTIRATTGIKGPDAIQLACAAAVGIELFVTNDERLQKVKIPGIHFVTSLDRLPF